MDLYIAILEKASKNELPEIIVKDSTLTYQSVLDLIDIGYLSGTPVTNRSGQIITNVAITKSGLGFLESHINQRAKMKQSASTNIHNIFLVTLMFIVLVICVFWLS